MYTVQVPARPCGTIIVCKCLRILCMVFESIETHSFCSGKFNLTFQSYSEAMPPRNPVFQTRLSIRASGRMERLSDDGIRCTNYVCASNHPPGHSKSHHDINQHSNDNSIFPYWSQSTNPCSLGTQCRKGQSRWCRCWWEASAHPYNIQRPRKLSVSTATMRNKEKRYIRNSEINQKPSSQGGEILLENKHRQLKIFVYVLHVSLLRLNDLSEVYISALERLLKVLLKKKSSDFSKLVDL